MKASDIPDTDILASVERHAKRYPSLGAIIWDIFKDYPDVPDKVVRAKLSQMVRRTSYPRLSGCCCGCRGGFNIVTRENA